MRSGFLEGGGSLCNILGGKEITGRLVEVACMGNLEILYTFNYIEFYCHKYLSYCIPKTLTFVRIFLDYIQNDYSADVMCPKT